MQGKWYCVANDTTTGPVTLDEVRQVLVNAKRGTTSPVQLHLIFDMGIGGADADCRPAL